MQNNTNNQMDLVNENSLRKDNNFRRISKKRLSIVNIRRRFKKKSQIIDYYFKKGFTFPKFFMFDFKFLLGVLKKTKNLLNVPITSDYNLKHFWKSKYLTLNWLSEIINKNPILKSFLPDDFKINRIPKCFLFTLLKTIKPDVYNTLRDDIQKFQKPQNISKLEKAYIEVEEEVFNDIEEILPMEEITNNKRANFVKLCKKGVLHKELSFDN